MSRRFLAVAVLGIFILLAVDSGSFAAAEPDSRANVALASRGAIVLGSSFFNTDEFYTDHLIDGDPHTNWKALDTARPQWLEIRWPWPQKVSGVRLSAGTSGQPKRWKVLRKEGTIWKEAGTAKDTLVLDFPEFEADRLKVVLDEIGVGPAALSAVEVLGLDQPVPAALRPYWKSSYVWHAEADNRLQMGSPRYFRKSFVIDDLSKVQEAWLQSRSNDLYVAYLNGQEVDHGGPNIHAVSVKDGLRQGENVLAYAATAQSDPGWGNMELLGELTIHETDRTITIGTDGEWKSSAEKQDGWNQAEFDENGWNPVAVLTKPPGGPWGKIPFVVSGPAQTVEVEDFAVEPANPMPGQNLEIRVRLRFLKPLTEKYLFEFTLRDPEVNSDRSDYKVSSVLLQPDLLLQDKDGQGNLKSLAVRLRLPNYAPHRVIPLAIKAYCLDGSGRELKFVSTDGKPFAPGIPIGEERPSGPGIKLARPVWMDSLSAFKLDEQILPPVHWSLLRTSFEQFQNYASTGMKVFEVHIDPYNIVPGTDYKTPHLEFVDQHIRNLLSVVPDAKILVLGDARAGGSWREAHPNALLKDAFGNTCAESLASTEYREAVKTYVRAIAEAIESKPYADHVIGYKFDFGPQPDACLGGVQSNEGVPDRSKWTVGDWNPEALKAFQDFLRRKYGYDVDALRKAWRNPSVDFGSAAPDLRTLVDIQPDHNLFRDPARGRMPEDYCEFLSGLLVNTYSEVVSPIIREVTKGRAWVTSYAGYVVENLRGINPASVQQNNTYGLALGNYEADIDCFCGTTSYEVRSAGDRFTPFQLASSLTLNGRQTLAEIDYRTFVAGPKTYARQRSEQESVSIVKRELATTLIRGLGMYFADWSTGEGRDGNAFFDDPEILSAIGRGYSIYKNALAEKDKPGPATQIAVIVSPETVWYQDLAYPAVVYNSLVRSLLYENISKIGAPYDVLQVNDLRFPKVRDQYKLFVFLNTFYVSGEQRKWIDDLKRDGKTLTWYYAPGYVNDSEGLSVLSMEKLTGMKLDLIPGRIRPEFQFVEGSHPLLKSLTPGDTVTVDAFADNTPPAEFSPPEIFPNFSITDTDTVTLGKDSEGRVRFAAKDLKSWKSVYSTVPNAGTKELRNIAEWAGVHLYTKPGVVVEANDRFLMIHNAGPMPENIEVHLPQSARVRELFSGRDVSTGGDRFTLTVAGPVTELFELSKK